MRKKENIRYDARHPGFGFPLSFALLSFPFGDVRSSLPYH